MQGAAAGLVKLKSSRPLPPSKLQPAPKRRRRSIGHDGAGPSKRHHAPQPESSLTRRAGKLKTTKKEFYSEEFEEDETVGTAPGGQEEEEDKVEAPSGRR